MKEFYDSAKLNSIMGKEFRICRLPRGTAKKIRELEEENQKLAKQISNLNQDLLDTQAENDKLNADVTSYTEENFELYQTISSLKDKINCQRKDLAELEEHCERLTDDKEFLQKSVRSLKAVIDSKHEELKKLRNFKTCVDRLIELKKEGDDNNE